MFKIQTYIRKRSHIERILPKIKYTLSFENISKIVDITTDRLNYFLMCLTAKSEVIIYDIRTFTKMSTISSSRKEKVLSFSLSSDNKVLALNYLGGINKFYDFHTGTKICETDLGEGYSCTNIAFSPCNKYVLCYYENDLIFLFNRNDLQTPINQYEVACVNSLSFSFGGELFCFCTDNGILQIQTVNSETRIKYKDKKEKFGSLIFETEDPHFLISASKKQGILTRWVIESKKFVAKSTIKIDQQIVGYSLSAERTFMYVASSFMCYAYDWGSCSLESELDLSYTGVRLIAVQAHPAVPHLALVVGKYTLGVWDVLKRDYNEFYVVRPESPLVSFAFWLDVTKVLCLLSDGKVLLFTTESASSDPGIARTCEAKGWHDRIKEVSQFAEEPLIGNIKEIEKSFCAEK